MRRPGLPPLVKLGVLAVSGLLALSVVLFVIGAIAGGDDDGTRSKDVSALAERGQSCADRRGDVFTRLEDPYYAIKPDADTTAQLRASMPSALADLFTVRTIRRGQDVAGTGVYVAIGDKPGDRTDFLTGLTDRAQEQGATLHPTHLAGHAVTAITYAESTMLVGLVPCAGLMVVGPDAPTVRHLWSVLADAA